MSQKTGAKKVLFDENQIEYIKLIDKKSCKWYNNPKRKKGSAIFAFLKSSTKYSTEE